MIQKKSFLSLFLFIPLALTSPQGKTDEDVTIKNEIVSEASHGKRDVPDYALVFDQNEVGELTILIDSKDWEVMQEDLKRLFSRRMGHGEDLDENPVWVPSTVKYNDLIWDHVGIRVKGNSSLRSTYQSGNKKFSFKLDFDEFEDDYPGIANQRFYGFKQLNLNNNFSDMSLMREKVGADLFREFGLVSARTAFYRVSVDYGDGLKFFGVYTLVEEVDDTLIGSRFSDDSGNLYKPDGEGASFAAGTYSDGDMVKKSNETEADYSDVRDLYAAINSEIRETDPITWKDNLEKVFNVEGFLKWLAANTVMQNWDSYGNMTHNYYLYNNPVTGRLNWLPWDNNEAFQQGKQGGALTLDMGRILSGRSWPLIAYLIGDPEYKEIYEGFVRQFASEVFNPDKMTETYSRYYELLKDHAYREERGYTFLRSDSSFDEAVDQLIAHVTQRNEAVRLYLDGEL